MNSALAQLLQSDLGLVATGVFLALIVVVAGLALRKLVRSLRARRRAARALKGERQAATLLAAHGFQVQDAQLSLTYSPLIGGRRFPVLLRADYLVSRNGKRYVAEVKTGERAPSLAHAPTRRQLLEYSVAFDVDGVLLVDVEAGRVQDVEFPRGAPAGRASTAAVPMLLGALAILALMLAHNLGLLGEAARNEPAGGRARAGALWSCDGR